VWKKPRHKRPWFPRQGEAGNFEFAATRANTKAGVGIQQGSISSEGGPPNKNKEGKTLTKGKKNWEI